MENAWPLASVVADVTLSAPTLPDARLKLTSAPWTPTPLASRTVAIRRGASVHDEICAGFAVSVIEEALPVETVTATLPETLPEVAVTVALW